MLQSMGSQRVGHDLESEQQQWKKEAPRMSLSNKRVEDMGKTKRGRYRGVVQGLLHLLRRFYSKTVSGRNTVLGISSVQSLSHVQLFVTPWIAARQASMSLTNSQSSLRLTSIESVMPSSHLILCHPLLLLPSIFPSIRVFSSQLFASGGQSIGVSASISVLSMKLISFRMDWLDLLKVQGTLKNLLQLLGISELK